MASMLEISIKYPEVYDRLMQEVFLTEQVYDGFDEVIEVIREKLSICAAGAREEFERGIRS